MTEELFSKIPTAVFSWEDMKDKPGVIRIGKSCGAMVVAFEDEESGKMFIIHEAGFDE